MRRYLFVLMMLAIFSLLPCAAETKDGKPTLYVVGDSTVKNGQDKGSNGQWGWGHFLPLWFDLNRIDVKNDAIGGRSSRTFITEGRWAKVCDKLRKGDYVLIQFGHNDGGELNVGRARASLKGIGEEYQDVVFTKPDKKEDEGKQERVYTYGHYLRQYIGEAKAKGTYPIVCSMVPRDRWKKGKVDRDSTYVVWAREVAKVEKVPFIDLHNKIADKYDELGDSLIKEYFIGDHTHTSEKGAMLNAEMVAKSISKLKTCKLKKFQL